MNDFWPKKKTKLRRNAHNNRYSVKEKDGTLKKYFFFLFWVFSLMAHLTNNEGLHISQSQMQVKIFLRVLFKKNRKWPLTYLDDITLTNIIYKMENNFNIHIYKYIYVYTHTHIFHSTDHCSWKFNKHHRNLSLIIKVAAM